MECREFPTVGGGNFPKSECSIPNNIHIQIRSDNRFYHIVLVMREGEQETPSHRRHISIKDGLQVKEQNKAQVKLHLLWPPLARSYRPTVLRFLEAYRNAS